MAGAPTSYGYPGTVNSAILADWLTRVAGARFSVGGKDDWKVSVQPGLDRGIRINGGIGVGDSVMDIFPDYDTRSLPLVANGSQWFLVVARRSWTTPYSTNFVIIAGTAEKKLPARSDTPGSESDQPVALVRVQAGSTVVQEIVDLRAWAGNGGVEAADVLGREPLARPGAAVKVGSDMHHYEYNPANGGSFAWKVYPRIKVDGVPAGETPIIKTGHVFLRNPENTANTTNAAGDGYCYFPQAFPTKMVSCSVVTANDPAAWSDVLENFHLNWNPNYSDRARLSVRVYNKNGVPASNRAGILIAYTAIGY